MPSIQAPITAASGSSLGDCIAPAAYQLTPSCRNRGVVAFTFFGVLIPFASVAVEVFLRGCSETLFDPLPTVWHGIFATAVPLINVIIFWRTSRDPIRWPRALRFLNAIALGSATYFCVTFLPLLPIGILAILAVGLGLLVLGPYFGLVAAFKCRKYLRESASGHPITVRWSLPVSLIGFVLPLVVLGGHDVR